MFDIEKIRFNEQGLVPAIVQDVDTKEVLMLAYMNYESINLTIETGFATFYSRSRQEIWKKGETSGNLQYVKSVSYDCDQDSILLQVEQVGVACHTGNYSCFSEKLSLNEENDVKNEVPSYLPNLYETILDRKKNPIEGSYTTYLFNQGIDKILKKIGEETSEVIIGAKNEGTEELIYEISDLVYHTMVLMVEKGIKLEEINNSLINRKEKVKS
ncbi:bifunctional phosphoribosyl-AMP cyclohydrolase/phosphoribosyl-ATP diphosphatase HisIE [Bacillus sp. AFS017336]|uniref:bifunctional phosphoribosyl-AMP cyclohydrolase/phosphoribosyl-ATP diphosphatase HisIE n=1 Tax=Bacillus sp. AFS017336 TaxID=2033489 RepID=UPI000BEF22D2|nr:bifunctional phosphoribosyl-AMP cyclohydrolase/phosphoribosyl-ATP diphosphatase HisIE [Bacillus sp. AFS017336]PEL07596.1 bifunctional phosphoribosyl-AMP cyclohydrolase/phosphoribosyl-ATP pyrophosphatase [Bacillus sp. AFS017336]